MLKENSEANVENNATWRENKGRHIKTIKTLAKMRIILKCDTLEKCSLLEC
jgi:hypothetical protein